MAFPSAQVNYPYKKAFKTENSQDHIMLSLHNKADVGTGLGRPEFRSLPTQGIYWVTSHS